MGIKSGGSVNIIFFRIAMTRVVKPDTSAFVTLCVQLMFARVLQLLLQHEDRAVAFDLLIGQAPLAMAQVCGSLLQSHGDGLEFVGVKPARLGYFSDVQTSRAWLASTFVTAWPMDSYPSCSSAVGSCLTLVDLTEALVRATAVLAESETRVVPRMPELVHVNRTDLELGAVFIIIFVVVVGIRFLAELALLLPLFDSLNFLRVANHLIVVVTIKFLL